MEESATTQAIESIQNTASSATQLDSSSTANSIYAYVDKIEHYANTAWYYIKEWAQATYQFLNEQPREYLFIGAAVVLVLSFFLYIMRKRRKRRIVIFRDGNGQIEMSRSTVEKMITDLLKEHEEIKKPHVSVCNKGGLLHFETIVDAQTNNLPQLYKDVKLHVQKVLCDSIGISNIGSFNMIIRKIKTTSPAEERQKKENADWPTLK